MNIYLVRHGEAEIFGQNSLTKKGQQQALDMAYWYKNKNIPLDKIVHSSKLRAIETAEIFSKVLSVKTEQMDGICPEDSPVQFIKKIEAVAGNVLVVTHMPFIELVTSKLSEHEASSIYFSNVTMVAFEKKEQWQQLWVQSPGDL